MCGSWVQILSKEDQLHAHSRTCDLKLQKSAFVAHAQTMHAHAGSNWGSMTPGMLDHLGNNILDDPNLQVIIGGEGVGGGEIGGGEQGRG